MAMNRQQMEIEQPKIIERFGFPNTYTFTKHMAELALNKRAKDIRFSVLRPSCINACYKEPFPGWLDQVGPSAGMLMPIGLGITQKFWATKPHEAAMVPCDVVANAIIVLPLYSAKQPEPKF